MSKWSQYGPTCKDCQLYKDNANWPGKKEGDHCYMFRDWDYKQDGFFCSNLDVKPTPDTAEENLMDNQL